MNNKRGSLLLIELMIVIAVFVVCSAVCLSMFVSANRLSERSEQLNTCSILAQNAAEQFKGSDGDAAALAGLYSCDEDNIEVFYTRDMQPADRGGGYYRLTLDISGETLKTAKISVYCGETAVFELEALCFTEVTR